MPIRKEDQFEDIIKERIITVETSLIYEVLEWVKYNYDPEDIFSDEKLAKWAEANGYVQPTE